MEHRTTMLLLLLIIHFVQANSNNTNFTGVPRLPDERQLSESFGLAVGEAALGGMVSPVLLIIILAILRILRVYQLNKQKEKEPSIKRENTVDFNQLDDDLKEL